MVVGVIVSVSVAVGVGVWLGGGAVGVAVWVMDGVKVKVGGRKGVTDAVTVTVAVPVDVTVGVGLKVAVAVKIPGVGEGPKVREGLGDGMDMISVLEPSGVRLAVGVGMDPSGLNCKTSHPRQ